MPANVQEVPRMEIDEIVRLAGSDEVQVVPRDWANLNKNLKTRAPKHSPDVPMKSKGTSAGASADPPKLTFKTFMKREHSNVYHKTRKDHERAGLDVKIAKTLAAEAARAKAAEVRGLYEEGKLAECV
jgi:hypothetical protein